MTGLADRGRRWWQILRASRKWHLMVYPQNPPIAVLILYSNLSCLSSFRFTPTCLNPALLDFVELGSPYYHGVYGHCETVVGPCNRLPSGVWSAPTVQHRSDYG
jgi:hypothetical protein